jgi:hypothetical protein
MLKYEILCARKPFVQLIICDDILLVRCWKRTAALGLYVQQNFHPETPNIFGRQTIYHLM